MSGIYLLYAKDFHAQLERLVKSGNNGKMAAKRCEEVFEIIRKEGMCSRNLLRKRTKRGEYRLKNCCKYALGNGYRLITVSRDGVVCVCFIGTHDETDRWLEQHRSSEFTRATFAASREEFCCGCPRIEEHDEAREQEGDEPLFIDEYEKKLRSGLTDEILRSVFSGLAR